MIKFLSIIIIILCSTQCFGEKAIKGLNFRQTAGGSYNPLGVIFTTHAFYRLPLIKKDGILWESTKIDIGLHNDFSPAFDNPGIFVQIEPIAVFDIRLQLNRVYLFKQMGNGYIALDSSRSPYDPETIKNRPQSCNNGFWLKVSPTLKFMLKKLIIANTFTFHKISMDKKGYYLERITNTRPDSDDVLFTNDIFTLYEFSKPFIAGVNFYSNRVQSTESSTHRLSLAAIYVHSFTPKTDFNGVILAGTYLKHDYLSYTDPYIGIQFEIAHRF